MEHNLNETLHKIRFIAEVDLAERRAKNLSPKPPTAQALAPVKQYGYAQKELVSRENSLPDSPSRSFHSRVYVR